MKQTGQIKCNKLNLIDIQLHFKSFYVSFNRSLLSYIMIPMMQRQLDEFCQTIWNNHRIRAQKDTLMADGIPNHIFEFPEKYGMENKGLSMLLYLGKLPCDILLNVQIGLSLTFLYFSYMDSNIKHIGIEASVHYEYGAQLSFIYWTNFPVQYLKSPPPPSICQVNL